MGILTHIRAIGIILFLILLLPPGNSPAGEMDVVTEIWPPFRIADPGRSQDVTGIDIDLLEMLSRRLGVPYTIRRMPWARCLEFMRTGEADLITGLAHTEERARYIRYSEIPYHTVFPAFYVRKGDADRIRTYEDLASFTIGYSLRSAYFEPFDSDTRLNKYGVSTERQLLRMLAAGHLFVIIGTDANVAYDIANLGLREKVERARYQPDQHTDLYVGISRASRLVERSEEIDRHLKEIVRNGLLLRYLEKYF